MYKRRSTKLIKEEALERGCKLPTHTHTKIGGWAKGEREKESSEPPTLLGRSNVRTSCWAKLFFSLSLFGILCVFLYLIPFATSSPSIFFFLFYSTKKRSNFTFKKEKKKKIKQGAKDHHHRSSSWKYKPTLIFNVYPQKKKGLGEDSVAIRLKRKRKKKIRRRQWIGTHVHTPA